MADGKSIERTKRVQFDFTPEAYQELVELQQETDATTKAEVVRYALRTLQWLINEINNGNRVLVDEDGNIQEAIFPFLKRRRDRQKIKELVGR